MEALRAYRPHLLARLPNTSEGFVIADSEGGPARCRDLGGRWVHGPGDPSVEAAATAAQVAEGGDRLYVLVRPGLGYMPLALLEKLGDRCPTARFLWLEDRLPLVRLALEAVDWSPFLMNRAIEFAFGPILECLEQFLVNRPAVGLIPTSIVVDGQSLLEGETLPEDLAGLVNAGVACASELSMSGIAAAEGTRSFRTNQGPRVLLAFEENAYLSDSVAAGFFAAGAEVTLHTSGQAAGHFTKHVDWELWLPAAGADVLIWTNRNPILRDSSAKLRRLGVRSVLWSLDDPLSMGVTRRELEECDLYLSYDAVHLPYAESLGAKRVAQLSTAAGLSPAFPDAENAPAGRGPALGFVGRLDDARAQQLRLALGKADPDLLEFLEYLACTNDSVVDAFARAGRPCGAASVFFVNHERTVRRRLEFLAPLRDLGLRTFGAGSWGDPIVSGSLAPAYGGRALPYGPELARAYYDTRINVNVFHAQCVDSTNSRIYDVLAAGGFLLSEDSPRLRAELVPGKHLVTFRTPAEALEKAAYYLEHPGERDTIAREGQKHVLAHHTYEHRAREVMRLLDLTPPSPHASRRIVSRATEEIPVFLNNRDWLTSTRNMVGHVRRMGGRPIILDNDSTFPPLLEWYASAPCEVLRLRANVGAYATWRAGLPARISGHYVVSDSDLDLAECPDDTLQRLCEGLDRYPSVTKVGLSLRIDDVPAHFSERVRGYEAAMWKTPVDESFFWAPTDTTFAVYHSTRPVEVGTETFYKALRSAPPYVARHLPWYLDPEALTQEEQHYLSHCRRGPTFSSWAKHVAPEGGAGVGGP